MLLIDPHSNDTVALGIVETEAADGDEQAEKTDSFLAWLSRIGLVARDAAPDDARRRVVEIAAGALLTGLIVFVLTGGRPGLALAGVLADIVLRPALGMALRHVRSWVAARRRAQADSNLTIDGGGI